MAYEAERERLKRVADRELKFGVYELHLTE